MKPITISSLLIVIFILNCTNQRTSDPPSAGSEKLVTGKLSGLLIANPIIYDVVVKNPDPEDSWAAEQVKEFKRTDLIDMIFQAVEDGKAQAFNYHTGKKMTLNDIKMIENNDEFDRSKIGKIQFIEDWYFDPVNLTMDKKVKSIMLAYEVYDQFGKVRGYKAAFRIDLN